MTAWVKDLECKRLVRSEPDPDLESKPEPMSKPKLQEMAQERCLRNLFYHPRITLHSWFNLLDLGPNVNFELCLITLKCPLNLLV